MSNGTAQNNRIPLDKAKKMTKKFRDHRERITIPGQTITDLMPISETFDREGFDALLAQPGCVAVRIYYSMDEELKVHAVVVGVDGNDRDIISSSTTVTGAMATASTTTATDTSTTTTEGVILEEARRCPPDCSLVTGDLNP